MMIKRDGAVLVLDYTYLGLLADKDALVGGVVYGRGENLKAGIDFYAPLARWSEQLGPLFAEDGGGKRTE